jgi:hypothetical protein
MLFAASVGVTIAGQNNALAPQTPERPAIIFVETAQSAPGDLPHRFLHGSRLVLLPHGTTYSAPLNLSPNFFAVADPQLSPSAARVAFAGQNKKGSPWQIWGMVLNGREPRLMFKCPAEDCFQPKFLPRGEMSLTAVKQTAAGYSSQVYVGKEDGSNLHPITFGPGNFEVESVMGDGRLLISAEAPLAPEAHGRLRCSLFVINADGSELCAFRREPAPPRTRLGATVMDDGTVVFIERPGPPESQPGGELAMIAPGALHSVRMSAATSAIESARQLDGTTLVVSRANLADTRSRGRYDLYSFDTATQTLGKLIYSNPKFSSVQAVPVEPTPAARYYWSILHPDRDTGRFICVNAHVSIDAAGGQLRNDIARVRVLALNQSDRRTRVLGEAPVEADGSFYLNAPADQPVRFELLNSAGVLVKAQTSWIWVRPGEDRACLGCHEDPALTPPNHWALALKRPGGPSDLKPAPLPEPAH